MLHIHLCRSCSCNIVPISLLLSSEERRTSFTFERGVLCTKDVCNPLVKTCLRAKTFPRLSNARFGTNKRFCTNIWSAHCYLHLYIMFPRLFTPLFRTLARRRSWPLCLSLALMCPSASSFSVAPMPLSTLSISVWGRVTGVFRRHSAGARRRPLLGITGFGANDSYPSMAIGQRRYCKRSPVPQRVSVTFRQPPSALHNLVGPVVPELRQNPGNGGCYPNRHHSAMRFQLESYKPVRSL